MQIIGCIGVVCFVLAGVAIAWEIAGAKEKDNG